MLGLVGALMAIPIAAAVRVVVGPMLHARDAAAEAKQATVAPADGDIPPAGG